MARGPARDANTPRQARFRTTRWSCVFAAGAEAPEETRPALERLSLDYWEPVYCYLRRDGFDREDAADLTQGFFARLIEKHGLRTAEPARGRFRSYLLGALRHYVANERRRARAGRRGGGEPVLSLDASSGEGVYALEPVDHRTPEALYARRWALALLERVLGELRGRYVAEGKAAMFDRLSPYLTGEHADHPYAAVGEELGMAEGAVKVAVHRLRRRYRELLRARVGETVDDPHDVTEEISFLIDAL